VLAVANLLA
jgi:hypothetical protein